MNETTTDTNSTHEITISSSVIVLGIIMILFGLAAIGGNSLIILCVIQYKSLRTNTNLLIANLAVVDFLNGCSWVICSAMTFSECIKKPTFSLISDNTKVMITLSPFLANNFAMLLIALERFICVHFALRYYSIITFHRTTFALSLTWLLSAVMCFTIPLEQLRNTVMPLVCLLCSIGILVFYSYVGYVACKKLTRSVPQPQVMDGRTAEALDNQKAQWKVTMFLAVVFGVYLGSVLLCTILIAFHAKRSIYDCNPTPFDHNFWCCMLGNQQLCKSISLCLEV